MEVIRGNLVHRSSPNGAAVYSLDERYRYRLDRDLTDLSGENPLFPSDVLPPVKPLPVVFIGLNPSTATETEDDPTIRRCIDFAIRLKATKLIMLNAFAFRATAPKDMKAEPAPIGEENDDIILDVVVEAARLGGYVIAAWGTDGAYRERSSALRTMLRPFRIYCLGQTGSGEPRHPLYLKASSTLEPYE
jgi:hypothetical protein